MAVAEETGSHIQCTVKQMHRNRLLKAKQACNSLYVFCRILSMGLLVQDYRSMLKYLNL